MEPTHRDRIETLLRQAAFEHQSLMAQLPPKLAASLPVDAQGVTRAIDHLAIAAGLSDTERRLLVANPPPANASGTHVVDALRGTYEAHERAAMMIAASLDGAGA